MLWDRIKKPRSTREALASQFTMGSNIYKAGQVR